MIEFEADAMAERPCERGLGAGQVGNMKEQDRLMGVCRGNMDARAYRAQRMPRTGLTDAWKRPTSSD